MGEDNSSPKVSSRVGSQTQCVEQPENLRRSFHTGAISSWTFRGEDDGSNFNNIGTIIMIMIQNQPIMVLLVSIQRVVSDGDTGYPAGHFWRGISTHLASATVHIAPVAPPSRARMRCFSPLARKYNHAPKAKQVQAMNFHISSCWYSSNTRTISNTSPP